MPNVDETIEAIDEPPDPEARGHGAILECVREIVTSVLEQGGYALAAPVAARFHASGRSSTGVEVRVRLVDASHAAAARSAIAARFGGAALPDVIDVS